MSDENKALVTTDNGLTDFGMRAVVTVDQAITRAKELQRFVAAVMVKDEDYGIIPGTGNKPTLFKPGAEKLCEMYGLVPTFEVIDKIQDWQEGFFFYLVKCTLISKHHGGVMAEGLGSCNSREKRYIRQDVYTIANTILKMAKKRAHVDTALSATRSSGVFTQDLDDIGDVTHEDARAPAKTSPAKALPPTPATGDHTPRVRATGMTIEARYDELLDKGETLGIVGKPRETSWARETLTQEGMALHRQIQAAEQAAELAALGAAK